MSDALNITESLTERVPHEQEMTYLKACYPYLILKGTVKRDEDGNTVGAHINSPHYRDMNSVYNDFPVLQPLSGCWILHYWMDAEDNVMIQVTAGNALNMGVAPPLLEANPGTSQFVQHDDFTVEFMTTDIASRAALLAIEQGWQHVDIAEGDARMQFSAWTALKVNAKQWTGDIQGYAEQAGDAERYERCKDTAERLYGIQNDTALVMTHGMGTGGIPELDDDESDDDTEDHVEAVVESEVAVKAKPKVSKAKKPAKKTKAEAAPEPEASSDATPEADSGTDASSEGEAPESDASDDSSD